MLVIELNKLVEKILTNNPTLDINLFGIRGIQRQTILIYNKDYPDNGYWSDGISEGYLRNGKKEGIATYKNGIFYTYKRDLQHGKFKESTGTGFAFKGKITGQILLIAEKGIEKRRDSEELEKNILSEKEETLKKFKSLKKSSKKFIEK